MKKLLKKIISLCFVATVLMSATVTASAAEQLTINEDAKLVFSMTAIYLNSIKIQSHMKSLME